MSREQTPPLANFVREAFGAPCADLLLLDLGEEPGERERKLYVREEGEGKKWELVVSTAVGPFPSRSEPLVLAALLKMLFGRGDFPSPLEFHMTEVAEELRRAGVSLTEVEIDRIISKYASLSYDKRQASGDESEGGGGGVYPLITGYIRSGVRGVSTPHSMRYRRIVSFESRFVEGLRQGEIVVAGIRFGRLG